MNDFDDVVCPVRACGVIFANGTFTCLGGIMSRNVAGSYLVQLKNQIAAGRVIFTGNCFGGTSGQPNLISMEHNTAQNFGAIFIRSFATGNAIDDDASFVIRELGALGAAI